MDFCSTHHRCILGRWNLSDRGSASNLAVAAACVCNAWLLSRSTSWLCSPLTTARVAWKASAISLECCSSASLPRGGAGAALPGFDASRTWRTCTPQYMGKMGSICRFSRALSASIWGHCSQFLVATSIWGIQEGVWWWHFSCFFSLVWVSRDPQYCKTRDNAKWQINPALPPHTLPLS